jgi:hypothetical protein
LTNIPRVLVVPLGSTKRIEELGAWTELRLTFGILTYPGLRTPSFEGELWPKLVAEAPSRKVMHAETKTKRAKTRIEILRIVLRIEVLKGCTSEKNDTPTLALSKRDFGEAP